MARCGHQQWYFMPSLCGLHSACVMTAVGLWLCATDWLLSIGKNADLSSYRSVAKYKVVWLPLKYKEVNSQAAKNDVSAVMNSMMITCILGVGSVGEWVGGIHGNSTDNQSVLEYKVVCCICGVTPAGLRLFSLIFLVGFVSISL